MGEGSGGDQTEFNRQKIQYMLWWRRRQWIPPRWAWPWGFAMMGLEILDLIR